MRANLTIGSSTSSSLMPPLCPQQLLIGSLNLFCLVEEVVDVLSMFRKEVYISQCHQLRLILHLFGETTDKVIILRKDSCPFEQAFLQISSFQVSKHLLVISILWTMLLSECFKQVLQVFSHSWECLDKSIFVTVIHLFLRKSFISFEVSLIDLSDMVSSHSLAIVECFVVIAFLEFDWNAKVSQLDFLRSEDEQVGCLHVRIENVFLMEIRESSHSLEEIKSKFLRTEPISSPLSFTFILPNLD